MVVTDQNDEMERTPPIMVVAREAGVSKATVSRVANNRPGVNVKTRQKVRAVIERLGYRPDETARGLSLGKSAKVGLNIGFSSRLNLHFLLFRQHLEAALFSKGLRIEHVPTDEKGLPEKHADLMVICSTFDEDPRVPFLKNKKIPFVALGKCAADFWVSSDEYSGGRQAAEHLLRLGHTRMLVVAGSVSGKANMSIPLHTRATSERIRGFRDALLDNGVALPNENILEGEFTGLGGFLAVRRALKEEKNFSAVFSLSDVMAGGVIKALEDHNLRVPDNVSVIGFDELPEVGESITTVRQNTEELANSVADLLEEAAAGASPRNIIVPVELVVRGTTMRHD